MGVDFSRDRGGVGVGVEWMVGLKLGLARAVGELIRLGEGGAKEG